VRRRLTGAILSVVALTIVLLGVPLAIAVEHSYQDSAVVVLQRRAAEALVEITLPLNAAQLRRLPAEADSEGPYTVYDATGQRLAGAGPAQASITVRAALAGNAVSTRTSSQLAVAVPITDRSTESVVGAVLVTQAAAVVDRRVERAELLMIAVAAVVLLIAWWVASAQSRRFTRPIEQLAEQAERIGDGGVVVEHQQSGLTEIDAVGTALASSSMRLSEQLSRERSFTADVSHQLRTPLAGLRLRLEAVALVDQSSVERGISKALEELDRLEGTVDHLLALSRDALPTAAPLPLADVLAAIQPRWAEQFGRAQRELVVNVSTTAVVNASRSALDQTMDILLANSLQHGRGRSTIASRIIAGGVAIDVEDEGVGIDAGSAEAIFDRGVGSGNGIGLALARTLVEVDGGRLLLTRLSPPRFSVLFSTAGSFTER
jgi:signal transduction histidine kinase